MPRVTDAEWEAQLERLRSLLQKAIDEQAQLMREQFARYQELLRLASDEAELASTLRDIRALPER
jgi:hypothetical protein